MAKCELIAQDSGLPGMNTEVWSPMLHSPENLRNMCIKVLLTFTKPKYLCLLARHDMTVLQLFTKAKIWGSSKDHQNGSTVEVAV